MGLFSKKKNDELNDSVEDQELNSIDEAENKENIEQEQDEWILVNGFKGTNKNMICRDTQYELNKTYTYGGKVEICESGYHFCKELKNVFGYYSLENGNRFFKVKCLVSKKQWESDDNKFTAKEITFTEELGYSELETFILEKYSYIKNEEDWNELNKIGIEKIYRKYFMNIMLDAGYGETFSNILYDNINEKIKLEKCEIERRYMEINSRSYTYSSGGYIIKPQQYYSYTPSYDCSKFDNLITKVKAFKEEGLSKDMSVYLLLK